MTLNIDLSLNKLLRDVNTHGCIKFHLSRLSLQPWGILAQTPLWAFTTPRVPTPSGKMGALFPVREISNFDNCQGNLSKMVNKFLENLEIILIKENDLYHLFFKALSVKMFYK